jgi:N-acetylglucosaminyldiphosphoundecaprenol N-acetyl-beta-D-mannosaminyltransferase
MTDGHIRVDVLGVRVSAVDMPSALARIARWIETCEQHYVCVTGVHGVMESQRDAELLGIHNSSGLTTPDGMPLVWAGHFAGASEMERVCGAELLPALCERAAQEGWKLYFYGGKEGVAEMLVRRLAERIPGLRIVGTYSPPFRALTPSEDDEVVERINRAAPDIVWVGLSTPKQERWMATHLGRLRAPVLIGVGAAFDLHAGLQRRAPLWMQRAGLEWLYRLAAEPKRLSARYLRNNPRFVVQILRRPPRLLRPGDVLSA